MAVVPLGRDPNPEMTTYRPNTLWDWDFPAVPNLVDVVVDGRPVKALAQISKQGFLYAFDRVTGKPIWPIEERTVATDASVRDDAVRARNLHHRGHTRLPRYTRGRFGTVIRDNGSRRKRWRGRPGETRKRRRRPV